VIGMAVRHDHERQLFAGFFRHLFDGGADAVEIAAMHAAVDQDVLEAGSRLKRQQKKVTEANPIHPHSDAVWADGIVA
jgi:hypothetical protein